jgi:hypothetical protein
MTQSVLDRMIEIETLNEDEFLILKETLTRIGIASTYSKTLNQTCHVLHKRGRYYLTHFKLLFELDGKPSTISERDLERVKAIAVMLQTWGLVKLKNTLPEIPSFKSLGGTVIPSSEKQRWTLVSKYQIGK